MVRPSPAPEAELTVLTHRALLVAAVLAWPVPAQHSEPKVRQPLPPADVIAELPADGGPEFNRLIFEASPYLLQHARNPVDWYPWGDEAFALAAKLDKPVFLSIGYSTCHWCHVMEHESFEDDDVAALMNEHFVCIKVDREERPDIDEVYMKVTQAMTGRGGWPMTVVMTPEKEPFFTGTYFPKNGRGGRAGMMELVPEISKVWKTRREEVDQQAAQIVAMLAQRSGGSPGDSLESRVLDLAAAQLAEGFDEARGGFSEAPKFPVPHNLLFLLRYWARTGGARPLAMAEKTLFEMRNGGIWDHLGYGFHRYSTDSQWLVPHFEKMLYDQALISMAYIEAFVATRRPAYRRTALEIFEYVLRDMTSPEGAFYSAEDADSEGEEGLFYFWTPAELLEVLGKEEANFAIELWSIDAGGNFRDEATGQRNGHNILHLKQDLASFAAARGISRKDLEARIEAIRVQLFGVREARIHPFKDDKILTDWNGLMIASLARGGAAFEDPRLVDAGRSAADYVLTKLRDDDGRLFKRARGARASLPAMLEDYAFVSYGLLELYEATFEVRYLTAAIELTDTLVEHFWDEENGGFFLAPDDGEALIVRSKDVYDGAIPSGNSVAALNLLRLGRFTGKERYEELADQTMRAFAGRANRAPSHITMMMAALDYQLGPSYEIVITGEPGAEDTNALVRTVRSTYLPNSVVLFRPAGEPESPIDQVAPYAASMTAVDGRASAYVCRDFVCASPVTDAEALAKLLRGE